jgi:hypothetical protein
MLAANRDAFPLPIRFARSLPSASSQTSASDISPVPVTATPWSARAPTNPALDDTSANPPYASAPTSRLKWSTDRLS